jgi:hypothetical protein
MGASSATASNTSINTMLRLTSRSAVVSAYGVYRLSCTKIQDGWRAGISMASGCEKVSGRIAAHLSSSLVPVEIILSHTITV